MENEDDYYYYNGNETFEAHENPYRVSIYLTFLQSEIIYLM